MPLFKSVAFDTDGVLVDSDQLHFEIFNEILKRHGFRGIKWDPYNSEGFISYDDKKFFEEYLKAYGHQRVGQPLPTVDQLVREKQARTHERLQIKCPKFFPYVRPVIKHLREKGVKLFEVTGASFQDTKNYFRKHQDIKKMFEVVISSDDDLPSKPDPAPYREGLNRLNAKLGITIQPNEVIVIEDSAKGVQSAKSAGMFVIGIENTTNPKELYESGADLVVKSLTLELFDEFLSLRKREEIEKPNLLERLSKQSCLSNEVNIGTAAAPIFLKRNQWNFEQPLETVISDDDISMLLASPA